MNYWRYGFRPATAAWEKLYPRKFEEVGFIRVDSCGVVFYHPERDVSMAVRGDDLTLCGVEEDLAWIRDLMKSWFEFKVRATLGPDKKDDKEVVIFGLKVRWKEERIEYEADTKHREKILKHFGMEEVTRPLSTNRDKGGKEQEGEEEELSKEEAIIFRGLAARLDFPSLDCPDLQLLGKPASREMSKPRSGSRRILKKIARYELNRDRVVWVCET